jgi:hypothetical protein
MKRGSFSLLLAVVLGSAAIILTLVSWGVAGGQQPTDVGNDPIKLAQNTSYEAGSSQSSSNVGAPNEFEKANLTDFVGDETSDFKANSCRRIPRFDQAADEGAGLGHAQTVYSIPQESDDESLAEDDEPAKNLRAAEPKSQELNSTWVRRRIQSVRTDIREQARVAPQDRSIELDYGMADWTHFQCQPKVFAWCAPDIRYQPLFFEDVALERYGQTLGFHRQTFRSGIHFFKSAITFPNNARHHSPWSCDYPLGFCRPGDCVHGIEQKHYLGRPH